MSTGCSSGGEVNQSATRSDNRLGTEVIGVRSNSAKKKRKLSEATRRRTLKRKLSKQLRASLWTGRCIKCQRNGKGANYCRNKVYHDAPDWRIERDCRLLSTEYAKKTLSGRGTVPLVRNSYVPTHIAPMDLAHVNRSANQQWHFLGQSYCFPNAQQFPLPVPCIQAPYAQQTSVRSSSQASYTSTRYIHHSLSHTNFGYSGAEQPDLPWPSNYSTHQKKTKRESIAGGSHRRAL